MDRPFRTLPMRTEPIDGEALDSWLERFAAAARYRTLTVAAEHSWSLSAELLRESAGRDLVECRRRASLSVAMLVSGPAIVAAALLGRGSLERR